MRRGKVFLLATVFDLLVIALGVELGLQAYTLMLRRGWEKLKVMPNYLCLRSDNPLLGYELKANYVFDDGRKRVVLNEHGIRDVGAVPTTNRWKAAFLGDSIAFGWGLDQKEVFTEVLQEEFERQGRRIKVLNFGVPGYDAASVAENLRVKDVYYHADAVYYLLNLNDYARKNTRFEGADNGMYRMYWPATLKTPWVVRKLVYRWHKQGKIVTPAWYRWAVEGNREWGADKAQSMAAYARERHQAFTVLILPAGCAYEAGHYRLQDLHDNIAADLRRRGIKIVDLAEALAPKHTEWFDNTDHLTAEGDRRLAHVVEPLVQNDAFSRLLMAQ